MKLRPYQKNLNKPAKKFLKARRGPQRAQVYAPTGAGKTVCFIELIKEAISRGKMNIAVLHPRIALSQNQLTRFREELGTSVSFTSFHSGVHVASNTTYRERSTTDAVKLSEIIESFNDKGQPHVTFSSYQSFDKLVKYHFDMVICDEAHYLMQPQFYSWLPKITADKILFYTATPISRDMEGADMDYTMFGDVIARVAPRELIREGYIVAPLVHQLECDTLKNSQGDDVDVLDIIAHSYVYQFNEVAKNGMSYHQMLVAARGVSTDLHRIRDNINVIWNKIRTISNGAIINPDIYTVDAGATIVNGVRTMDRASAIEEITESQSNAIICHYDTLSEGIDIDSLGGSVIMRVMNKAKFIQTIGRTARPNIKDLLKDRTPNPRLFDMDRGIDCRIKPRCIVTLPVINGHWIANSNGEDLARAFIIAGYDDLSTYMPETEDRGNGGKRDADDWFNDDDDSGLQQSISNVSIHRKFADLRELFEF